ncbi:MAG: hypothetical protein P8046_02300 [Anaerolineales bacterium]
MKLIRIAIQMLLLALLAAVVFAACSLQGVDQQADLPDGAYLPASVFSRFYKKNGGFDTFRNAISTTYTNPRGETFQFYETVLMVYDPIEDKIYFDDLGNQLGLRNLPIQEWAGPITQDGLMVGKYYIHPAFVSLYLDLGPDMVGQPLTQPYYNFSRNRLEQHFENMGLFVSLDDPEQTVSLLNYGEVVCESCSLENSGPTESIIDPPVSLQSFFSQMDFINVSLSVSGEALNAPSAKDDGSTEVVFENMAVYEQDGVFRIRQIPIELDLKDPNLFYPLNSSAFVFYEIKNGTGHNVLAFFDEYIRSNGGYQVSGAPITEIIKPDSGLQALRQCFENLCLDYFPYVDGPQVRPVPLGDRYLEKAKLAYLPEEETAPQEDSGEDFSSQPRNLNPFTLLLWESDTIIDSSSAQVVYVLVELESTPQAGKELVLTVKYPDGHEEQILMPATDEDGNSTFTLPPVQGENGDLVYYEACLYVQNNMEPACVQQSFLIWGNP